MTAQVIMDDCLSWCCDTELKPNPFPSFLYCVQRCWVQIPSINTVCQALVASWLA